MLVKNFKLHTPNLLKEVTESGLAEKSGVLFIPLNTLRVLLGLVAERASQINDPILNDLMCKMTLYEIADPTSKEYNKSLLIDIEKKSKAQKIKEGLKK